MRSIRSTYYLKYMCVCVCVCVCVWPWSRSCGVCAGGRPSPPRPRTACRRTRSSLGSSNAGGTTAPPPAHVTSSTRDIIGQTRDSRYDYTSRSQNIFISVNRNNPNPSKVQLLCRISGFLVYWPRKKQQISLNQKPSSEGKCLFLVTLQKRWSE